MPSRPSAPNSLAISVGKRPVVEPLAHVRQHPVGHEAPDGVAAQQLLLAEQPVDRQHVTGVDLTGDAVGAHGPRLSATMDSASSRCRVTRQRFSSRGRRRPSPTPERCSTGGAALGPRLLRQAQDPLADDVPLDLGGAAGDACAGGCQQAGGGLASRACRRAPPARRGTPRSRTSARWCPAWPASRARRPPGPGVVPSPTARCRGSTARTSCCRWMRVQGPAEREHRVQASLEGDAGRADVAPLVRERRHADHPALVLGTEQVGQPVPARRRGTPRRTRPRRSSGAAVGARPRRGHVQEEERDALVRGRRGRCGP